MTKELQAHLAQPENRIRYCIAAIRSWADPYTGDAYQVEIATAQLYYWIAKAEDAEAHY